MGGITGEYADSDVAGIGPVVLTTEWQQFTIDLEGKDVRLQRFDLRKRVAAACAHC